MSERALFGLSLGCALLFGATAGCDSGGKTNVMNGAGAPAASAGSSGTGGTGGSSVATTCTQSAECTDQVCSPDGRCVDCIQDTDCLVNQHCDTERCIANGGDVGGGGSGGSGATAGNGGTGAGSACGAQVVFVIQRSGAMFEQPEGETSYWSMVQSAVAAEDGAVGPYASRLSVGASFFVRLQYDQDMACPVVSSQAPTSAALMALRTLFDTNEAAYQSLADENAKMDAPVAEAVSSAAALLTSGTKHLVLVSTGVPDTCDEADTICAVDPAIKAVQAASAGGVTTHVVGLGNTDALNNGGDEDGYGTYLAQLANAGAGKPVKKSRAFEDGCSDESATATYGESSGDAQAYRAESAAEVKAAVAAILQKICP
ncbi:MAG: hypothetical protein K0R38_4443 [Polyangiaceae bacterium]|nr:hypothetical protein [Polyangiaceae bacterium]